LRAVLHRALASPFQTECDARVRRLQQQGDNAPVDSSASSVAPATFNPSVFASAHHSEARCSPVRAA
jgi:hypothetical protein